MAEELVVVGTPDPLVVFAVVDDPEDPRHFGQPLWLTLSPPPDV